MCHLVTSLVYVTNRYLSIKSNKSSIVFMSIIVTTCYYIFIGGGTMFHIKIKELRNEKKPNKKLLTI